MAEKTLLVEKLNKIVFDKRVIIPLLLVVVACIFITPLYSAPVTPQPAGWGEDSAHSQLQGIYIVDTDRPEQLTDAVVELGIRFATAETGWEIPEVKTGPMPPNICLSWDAEGWGKASAVPCLRGWIVVLHDDRLLVGAPTDGAQTHGRTFLGDKDNDSWPDFPTDWATVVLSDSIQEPDMVEFNMDEPAYKPLPPDAYALLWTHELLHGLGYGHTFTRIIPGLNLITMERTGHILNKNLLNMGWDGAGLDTWDRKRKKSYGKAN